MIRSICFLVQDNSNLGDDLLLVSTVDLCVNILNTEEYKRNPAVLLYLPSQRLKKLVAEVFSILQPGCMCRFMVTDSNTDVDLLIHCGGTLFTYHYRLKTKIRGLFFKSPVKIPTYKKFIQVSLGVDPKVSWPSALHDRLGLTNVTVFRDPESLQNAFSFSSFALKGFTLPDIVFSFPIEKLVNNIERVENRSNGSKLVCVPRYWPFRSTKKRNSHVGAPSISKVFVAFSQDDEQLLGGEDFKLVYRGDYSSMVGVLSEISTCHTMITDRYHGAIVASLLGLEVIASNLDHKLGYLSSETSLRHEFPDGSSYFKFNSDEISRIRGVTTSKYTLILKSVFNSYQI